MPVRKKHAYKDRDDMVRWKRLFYYLVINVLVSACTVVGVLSLWEKYRPSVPFDTAITSPKETLTASMLAFLEQETVPSELTPVPSLPTPTRALTTYIVTAGDTLSEIAEQFKASLQEILELNPELSDPNALSSGQVLIVPEVQAGLESTPGLVSTIAPGFTPEPPQAVVEIVNVFGAGDLPTERIRLEQQGENEVSLAGWSLTDEDGNIFIFPYLSLYKGGGVDVYTRVGVNNVAALYWGLDAALLRAGERITLLDSSGAVRSVFQVP